MKKHFKKFTALLLSTLLLISPLSVKASAQTPSDIEEYFRQYYKEFPEAAVEDVVEIIKETYMGEPVSEETLYNWALYGITLSLDGYSDFFTEEELEEFLFTMDTEQLIFGLSFTYDSGRYVYIREVVENSSAFQQGLKPKDKVIKMNGISVAGLDIYDLHDALDIRGNGTATLEIERDGQPLTVNIVKQEVTNASVKVLKIEDAFDSAHSLSPAMISSLSNARYISISVIADGTSEEFRKISAQLQAEGVTEIIIDLRSNTGGYLEEAINICKQIVPKGDITTRVSRTSTSVVKSELEKVPFNKIIVLTDPYTASASELITSALQDSGSIIVGEKSYGKGVGQGIYTIPGVGYLKLTTEEYLRRSGGKINKVGITPNVIVEPPEYLIIKDATDTKDIIAIEKLLILCGYDVKFADGAYDEQTKTAVKKFKSDHGLEANDVLNSVTKFAMNQMLFDTTMTLDTTLEVACKQLRPNVK